MFHIGGDRPVNLGPLLPHTYKGSVAILICICCIYAMVSNIIYKSSLLSMLIAHPVPEIKIKDLIEENYEFVTDRLIAELHLPMIESEIPLENVAIVNYNACKMFEQILIKRAVILGEFSRNVLHIVVHCQKYFSGKFRGGLIIQNFGVTPFAWPFRAGAPFVNSFNIYHKLVSQSEYQIKGPRTSKIFFRWLEEDVVEKNFARREAAQVFLYFATSYRHNCTFEWVFSTAYYILFLYFFYNLNIFDRNCNL